LHYIHHAEHGGTERVLVDGDELFVGHNLKGSGIHVADVVCDHCIMRATSLWAVNDAVQLATESRRERTQRSLSQAPQGKLSSVLRSSHATIADLKQIRIIPAARSYAIYVDAHQLDSNE